MCLEAARGPKCCLIFSKGLEPQILVFDGGQESTLHHYPAAMSAVLTTGEKAGGGCLIWKTSPL